MSVSYASVVLVAISAVLLILVACTAENTMPELPGGRIDAPTLEDLTEIASQSVVQIDAGKSIGSGFIISEDGMIVTNEHVVRNRHEVTIRTADGHVYEGLVLGRDVNSDLAMVQILGGEAAFLPLALGNSEELRLGETVVALGFPIPEAGSDIAVTRGILSSIKKSSGIDLLQTDAALNPGNSGGPLLSRRGLTIGVISFKLSGIDVDNVGFAVSVNELESRLESLKRRPSFISVSSGFSHMCALLSDGVTICQGENQSGQSSPPQEPLTAISSGGMHTCGLREDSSVICWGSIQSAPTKERFTSISSGWSHTCGLRQDGQAVCWGSYNEPACGIYTKGQVFCPRESRTPPRAKPPSDERFTSISSDNQYTCGLRENGKVVCWGGNPMGPSGLQPSTLFTSISGGWSHACGLREDGKAFCWGNRHIDHSTPFDERFTVLSSGVGHVCGIRKDGKVICWGNSEFDPPPSLADKRFTAISSGFRRTCGIIEDGLDIVCWP